MVNEKEYYAFISYKREDEKWAKWLQHKLEHYRFPTNLNGRTDLPKNIRPTFRDVTDLNPGLLSEEINKALRNSQWLIIICSPRSAQSPWVCKEAQTFIDIGRADHIIPFVIEGTPFSNNPTTECYPEALLNLTGSNELLAANTNEMGRDAAAIKVVSRMFGLRFDTLWQRHLRERKKKIAKNIFITFLITTTIICLLFFLYSQLKTNKQKNQSRLAAEYANILVEEGNSYQALKLLLTVLPNDNNDRLFIDEACDAFRNAYLNNNVTFLAGHSDYIYSVDFSHDGNQIVTTSADGTVKLWSSRSGALIKNINTDTIDKIQYAFFLKDDKNIATSSIYGTIKIWNVETGDATQLMAGDPKGYAYEYGCPVFSLSDNVLFVPKGEVMVKVNASSGKHIGTPMEGHKADICTVSLSPDGKRIVTASWDRTIRIWDVMTGKQIGNPLIGHTSRVCSASFSPDGAYIVSASWDRTLRVWDANTGALVRIMYGHTGGVVSANFSHDGNKIVSASSDSTIRIWDFKSGMLTKTLKGHNDRVTCASFSPDDKRIVSASSDVSIIWDFQLPLKHLCPEFHTDYVYRTVYSPNGKLIASASWDKTVKIWDADTKKLLHTLTGHTDRVVNAKFSPNGDQIVSASWDGSVRIWDVETGGLQNLSDDDGKVLNASFSSDGERVVYTVETDDKHSIIKIWDLKSGKLIKLFNEYWDRIIDVQFIQNDTKIVATSQQYAYIYDIEYGSKKRIELGHHIISCADISSDGKHLAVGYWLDTIEIWDINSNSVSAVLCGHNSTVHSVSFSINGNYIVSASLDRTIRIWNPQTGDNLQTWAIQDSNLWDASFSYDGARVVSAGDNGIYIISTDDNSILQIPNNNLSEIEGLIKDIYNRIHFKKYPLTQRELRQYHLE